MKIYIHQIKSFSALRILTKKADVSFYLLKRTSPKFGTFGVKKDTHFHSVCLFFGIFAIKLVKNF